MVLRKPLLAGAMATSQPVALPPKLQGVVPFWVRAKVTNDFVPKAVPAGPLVAAESWTVGSAMLKFLVSPPPEDVLKTQVGP